MKEYNFEYFNQKYTQKLVIKLFVIFLTFFSILCISNNNFVQVTAILLSLIIPYVIFNSKKKNIKRIGSATLYDTHAEFKLDEIHTVINFSEIKSYLIQNYNGSMLNIKFKDGKKFNLAANINYCKTLAFDNFCDDLDYALSSYKNGGKVDLIRKNGFFQNVWVFRIMWVVTLAFLFAILYAIVAGKNIPFHKLLLAIGPLLTMWGYYWSSKK